MLTGQGPHFCAGIDLELVGAHSAPDPSGCHGRKAERLRRQILNMQVQLHQRNRKLLRLADHCSLQSSLTSLEWCRWPVIAAAHGARTVSSNG